MMIYLPPYLCPMAVDVNDALIDKLCGLAKLDFAGADRETIRQDLNRMLSFVEQVQGLDTTGIEPLIHMTEEPLQLRADEPSIAISHEEALKNAPKRDSDYIRVPKVL